MPPRFITPYFPIFSAVQDTSPDIATVSAIFGGSFPVFHSDEEWPLCSACGGPLVPFIQINASSPETPAEFTACLGISDPLNEREEGPASRMTLFQLFICAEETVNGTCFEGSALGATAHNSWMVRVAHFNPAGASGHEIASEVTHALSKAVTERGLVLTERTVIGWKLGHPEMEDWETMDDDFDEELYKTHAPAAGLKLLGFPMRGKYFSQSIDGQCPEPGDHSNSIWRNLVQLGTYYPYSSETEDEDEDASEPFSMVGNTWIDQCGLHPGVLDVCMSGNY